MSAFFNVVMTFGIKLLTAISQGSRLSQNKPQDIFRKTSKPQGTFLYFSQINIKLKLKCHLKFFLKKRLKIANL